MARLLDATDVVAVKGADGNGDELRNFGRELTGQALQGGAVAVEDSSEKSTRSILLMAAMTMGMPRSAGGRRGVAAGWARMPLRASTRTMATSAVEAPVAMLRVYCSWPGVSAMMKFLLGVEK